MQKLKFYDIDENYMNILRACEPKIPHIGYNGHNKFVCGVVFDINSMKYYAPISSFKKQQKTNFMIHNESGEPISSIRFCFMFPVPINVLALKIFDNEEYNYKRLLITELSYCNKHIDTILSMANKIYKIGTNPRHPLSESCCNFNILETTYNKYITE